MTKIAVLTDTHANLPALEAALTAIGELGCEAIYHTGDAVGAGAFPAEVVDRLLHTPAVHLVMGNHDAWCAFGLPDPRPGGIDDLLAANSAWTRAQVGLELRSAMAAWPYELVETLGSCRIAFLHYPLDSDSGRFVPIVAEPSGEDLDALFVRQYADLIFYGHHHPFVDHTGRARYVNPGSLGCGPDVLARFAVVEATRPGTLEVRHHAVPYDRAPLHEALVRRDVPGHQFLRQAFFP